MTTTGNISGEKSKTKGKGPSKDNNGENENEEAESVSAGEYNLGEDIGGMIDKGTDEAVEKSHL